MQRLRATWSRAADVSRGSLLDREVLFSRWALAGVAEKTLDRYYRWRNLDTRGTDWAAYGPSSWRYGYVPTPWLALRQMFPRGSLGTDDVVIDYGSGRGRTALWIAAHFPVRRVIGVDIDTELCSAAQANAERWSGRLRCRDVQFLSADATEFEVPDDVSVAYFYNPFRGPVFDGALAKLRESLARNPRRAEIVYFHPLMHDSVIAAGFSLERSRRNRSWVTTATASEISTAGAPWLPEYLWAVYRG